MRKYKFSFCIVLCVLLMAFSGCRKDEGAKASKGDFEIDEFYERGSLRVHVRLSRDKITIAETVFLQFEATVEQGFEIQMPKVADAIEDFGIVDWVNLGDSLDEENNIVQRSQYRLEPFLSGQYQIPFFTFSFYDANSVGGPKHELVTEPIDIEVTSLLGSDIENLVIADIEDVVEMPKESRYFWAWTGGAVLILGGIVFWLRARSRDAAKLVKKIVPAHEIAYEKLQKLTEKKLVEAGKIKQFYEEVSDILRHYIEDCFELKAPERTTEEFLIEMQHTELLLDTQKDDLEKFLRHCDLVKFAKHNPTMKQIQQTFDTVGDFIEKTKPIPEFQFQARAE